MNAPTPSAPWSAVHWLALLAATAVTWLPIVALERIVAAPAPGTHYVAGFASDAARFAPAGAALAPADQPKPADTAFAPIALPDDWSTTHPEMRAGWYRIRFDATAGAALGVYLPSVAMNAAAYVNGSPIGDGGRFAPTVARNWNCPLLFAIPPSVLATGGNVLDLYVASDLPGRGFLPPLAVAELTTLAPVHARVSFVRRTLLWTLIVFRLVAALFTAAIFAMWRREPYYGWFALCVVAWVLAEVNVIVVDVPMSLAAWYWCFTVAIGWWGIFAVRLVLSFIGVSQPRAERRLMQAGVVGSLALAVLAASGSPAFHPLASNAWLICAFGASLYLFYAVLPRLRRHPDAIELNVVFVVALSVVGCVLVDLLMQLGLRPRGGLVVPPYGAFVAVVGMGWVLVRRFVGALTTAQALAVTLEERVREESAAVAASYRRILATERARVLSEERERILRDTDEGLGAQLVTTLALLERPECGPDEIQRSVRAALDDLRLVVDSLDPLEGDVVVMLATLRARWQARWDAAALRVEWRVADLPPVPNLTPHRVLQILRIVQAVFAGALAGGAGATLRVATRTTMTEAIVEIVAPAGLDDPVAIAHMRARAADVGATLDVARTASIVTVRLALALVASRPAPAASLVRGIATAETVG